MPDRQAGHRPLAGMSRVPIEFPRHQRIEMKRASGPSAELDVDRLKRDRSYREAVARELLARAGQDADHVQLRRAARRAYPRLEREAGRIMVGRLVGTASTLRQAGAVAGGSAGGGSPVPGADTADVDDGAVVEAGELDYPDRYTDLDLEQRNLLIRFCDSRIQDGSEGSDALEAVRERFGWPYPDRTFYVGPWKAARMRRRKIERRRAARAEAERAKRAEAKAEVQAARVPEAAAARRVEDDQDGGGGLDVPLEGEEEGEVELTTPSALYHAVRQDGGEWEVQVRARVDGPAMRRLFADAVDVLFHGHPPRSGSAGSGGER